LATNFFIYKGEVSGGQVALLSVGMVLEKIYKLIKQYAYILSKYVLMHDRCVPQSMRSVFN